VSEPEEEEMNRNKFVALCLILVFLVAASLTAQENSAKITATIIYDNYDLKDSDLKEDWGFAAIIRGFDKLVLFDTGTKGDFFMGNLEKAGVKPEEIEVVILSHQHYDHIGGLQSFLKSNSKVKVYIPASFADSVRQMIKNSGAECIDVSNKMEILPGLFTTGEMGKGLIEQSIYFDCTKGRGIITGCAHPGIENIVEFVHNSTGKTVGTVIGGFHLMSASESRLLKIAETLDNAGVSRLLATHCTGDPAREFFKKHYGDRFIQKGLSETIEIK
jgi:7,8-dihydropterin-6-yl-methyl-4-(beta-D-ribofuranosyl)aminobenzene 5'-phosphate synthase